LNVDLVSLAKEKNIPLTPALSHKGERGKKKPERVFLLNRKDAIVLSPNSPEFRLLVNLRDEAHRFGITFHRKLRGKKSLTSILDDIEGIGPSRKKNLLKTFGTIQKMREASLEQLLSVSGMSQKLVEKLHQKLHQS